MTGEQSNEDERRPRWHSPLGLLPTSAQAMLMARLALRAIPLLEPCSRNRTSNSDLDFVLIYFHCAALAWTFGQDSDGSLVPAGRRAADRLNDLADSLKSRQPSDAGGVAYYAARSLGEGNADEPMDAAVEFFARALAVRRRRRIAEQRDAIQALVIEDIALLKSGARLENQSLWRGEPPRWFVDSWSRMQSQLLISSPRWQVWAEWYEARLLGLSNDRDLEKARIELVDRGLMLPAAELNELLARLMGLRDDEAESAEPVPVPGPYRVLWIKDRLEALPSQGGVQNPSFAEDLLDGIRELAQNLHQALVNNVADPALRSSIETLLGNLSASSEDVRIGRLQIDLRVVQGFASSYGESPQDSDRTIAGMLLGLRDALSDFASQFPAIREMEAGRAALHVVAQEDIEPLLKPLQELVSVAAESPVVGKSVVDALVEGDREISVFSSQIRDPRTSLDAKARAIEARSGIIGQKLLTVWNFGTEALRWSKPGIDTAARAAGRGAADGLQKGVEKVVSATITGSAASLALALGNPMLAISLIVETFSPLAKRTKKEDSAEPPAKEQAASDGG